MISDVKSNILTHSHSSEKAGNLGIEAKISWSALEAAGGGSKPKPKAVKSARVIFIAAAV